MSRVQWEMHPLEVQGAMMDVGVLSEDIVRVSNQYRNVHLACVVVSYLHGKMKQEIINLKGVLIKELSA